MVGSVGGLGRRRAGVATGGALGQLTTVGPDLRPKAVFEAGDVIGFSGGPIGPLALSPTFDPSGAVSAHPYTVQSGFAGQTITVGGTDTFGDAIGLSFTVAVVPAVITIVSDPVIAAITTAQTLSARTTQGSYTADVGGITVVTTWKDGAGNPLTGAQALTEGLVVIAVDTVTASTGGTVLVNESEPVTVTLAGAALMNVALAPETLSIGDTFTATVTAPDGETIQTMQASIGGQIVSLDGSGATYTGKAVQGGVLSVEATSDTEAAYAVKSVDVGSGLSSRDLNGRILMIGASMTNGVYSGGLSDAISTASGTPDFSFSFNGASGLQDFWNESATPDSGIDARVRLAEGGTEIFIMSDQSNGAADYQVIRHGVLWADLAHANGCADIGFYQIWSTQMPGTGVHADYVSLWRPLNQERVRLQNIVVAEINARKRPGTKPLFLIPTAEIWTQLCDAITAAEPPSWLDNMYLLYGGANHTSVTDGHPSSLGQWLNTLVHFGSVFKQKCTLSYADFLAGQAIPSPLAVPTDVQAWAIDWIWDRLVERSDVVVNDTYAAPDVSLTPDAIQSTNVFAPADAGTISLRDAGTLAVVATADRDDVPTLLSGSFAGDIQASSAAYPTWTPAAPILQAQRTPGFQLVGVNTFNGRNLTGVAVPTGRQVGDTLLWVAAQNQIGVNNPFGNPGASTPLPIAAHHPNRLSAVDNTGVNATRGLFLAAWGTVTANTLDAYDDILMNGGGVGCVYLIRGGVSITAQPMIAQDHDENVSALVLPDATIPADGTLVIDSRFDVTPAKTVSQFDLGPYYLHPANVTQRHPDVQRNNVMGQMVGVISDRVANVGDDVEHTYHLFGTWAAIRNRSWRLMVAPT